MNGDIGIRKIKKRVNVQVVINSELPKISVDKLPENCRDCLFFTKTQTNTYYQEYCWLTTDDLSQVNQRPKWCPLTIEKENMNMKRKGEGKHER